MSDKVIQMDSWPYKRRTFPTYLKEAFFEQWLGKKPYDPIRDDPFHNAALELDDINRDIEKISGVSEYSRGPIPEPYKAWRQIPSSIAADIERGYNEVHGTDWNDPQDIRNLADRYAEWSDEHHRLSSEVSKHVGFYTVDEDDLEHLEPEDDDDDSD